MANYEKVKAATIARASIQNCITVIANTRCDVLGGITKSDELLTVLAKYNNKLALMIAANDD